MKLFGKKETSPAGLDDFHAGLAKIVKSANVTYIGAFIQYMDNEGLEKCSRGTVEQYLASKGLCNRDIEYLADEYFRILDLRN